VIEETYLYRRRYTPGLHFPRTPSTHGLQISDQKNCDGRLLFATCCRANCVAPRLRRCLMRDGLGKKSDAALCCGRLQHSPLLPNHYIDVTADIIRILRPSRLPSGSVNYQLPIPGSRPSLDKTFQAAFGLPRAQTVVVARHRCPGQSQINVDLRGIFDISNNRTEILLRRMVYPRPASIDFKNKTSRTESQQVE
jgi:hypothetical protein